MNNKKELHVSRLIYGDIHYGKSKSLIVPDSFAPSENMQITIVEYTLSASQNDKLRKVFTGRQYFGRITSLVENRLPGLMPGFILITFVKN